MIYFCIPAYNEERTVGVVLWKLRQVMAELDRDYQIIVADDASTDSTPAVLSPYIRVLPLTVIRNQQRRGYADSLEIALREAVQRSPYPKRDAVITLQADFTEDPDAVPLLIKRIEAGADVVATDVAFEPGSPRLLRWGRRFLRWFFRGRTWAMGDPLSGLRAYRVVVLKRAIDTCTGGRLLTWSGYGANAELLRQTVPQSRRTDVVQTTLKYHRLQRVSRFSFFAGWREARGAASGRPSRAASALPADSAIAIPQPVSLEVARKPDRQPGHGRSGGKPTRERTRPSPQRGRSQRKTKHGPEKKAPPAAAAPLPADAQQPKKKRRRRRKKQKRTELQTPTLVVEPVEPAAVQVVAEEGTAPDAAPKKKSRRGRRGGRGRRRGARPNGNPSPNTPSGNGSEPPPLAAEGD